MQLFHFYNLKFRVLFVNTSIFKLMNLLYALVKPEEQIRRTRKGKKGVIPLFYLGHE